MLREFLEGFKGAEQTGGAVSLGQFEAYFAAHSSKIEVRPGPPHKTMHD